MEMTSFADDVKRKSPMKFDNEQISCRRGPRAQVPSGLFYERDAVYAISTLREHEILSRTPNQSASEHSKRVTSCRFLAQETHKCLN